MGNAIVGQWSHLGWVAAKAALLFLVALMGVRVSARRTLAELSVYDFVTAVAVGAIVGRVPNASATSFVAGAVTLVVLLGLHRAVGMVRLAAPMGRLLDHRPSVLVRHGRVDGAAMRRVQLTGDDLATLLRAKGVTDLGDTAYVIFEPNGALSTVRPDQAEGNLVSPVVSPLSQDGG